MKSQVLQLCDAIFLVGLQEKFEIDHPAIQHCGTKVKQLCSP